MNRKLVRKGYTILFYFLVKEKDIVLINLIVTFNIKIYLTNYLYFHIPISCH